jgi:hypothetical protein
MTKNGHGITYTTVSVPFYPDQMNFLNKIHMFMTIEGKTFIPRTIAIRRIIEFVTEHENDLMDELREEYGLPSNKGPKWLKTNMENR